METKKPVTLLLIRHGQAQSNVSRILASYPEARPMPLSERGREEVQKTADSLRGKHIDAIFASPLTRTKETAAIISEAVGVPVTIDTRLRETDFGTYNNKSTAYFFLRYPDPSLRQFSNSKTELEGLASVRKRLTEFLRDIQERYAGKTVVIVTHSDLIHELIGIVNGTGRYRPRIATGSLRTVILKDIKL